MLGSRVECWGRIYAAARAIALVRRLGGTGGNVGGDGGRSPVGVLRVFEYAIALGRVGDERTGEGLLDDRLDVLVEGHVVHEALLSLRVLKAAPSLQTLAVSLPDVRVSY